MSLFAIENVFIAVLALALAVIISKFAQNKTHRIWCFFNLAITAWAFSLFLVGISNSEKQAIIYWKAGFVAVPFIGAFFYHFVLTFCNLKRPWLLRFSYLHAIAFSLLSAFTNLIIHRAPLFMNAVYFETATLVFTIFFIIWSCIVIMAFFEFYFYKNNTTGIIKIQSEFMFWSMMIGFVGGVSTALPGYGIQVYPCFQISIVFYILFTTYTIFKHGFIPMDEVIKRSLFYSTLVTSVTILYFVGIVVFQKLFENIIGFKNLAGSLVTLVGIAIIFIPLKNRIQSMVDKIFLKRSPIEIAVQNENLLTEVAKTEKLKTIADLASMLIHEIKNPLANLITYTEDLKAKKDEPQFIEKYQNLVINEIERINSRLKEVLDYAKPSEPLLKKINPNKIIEQVLMLIQSKCERANIKIILNLNTNYQVLGDSNLIFQAIFNLVLNAIDAMPQGGTLTVTTDCESKYLPNLSNARELKKELYYISISDTGCGIDQKDLTSIFIPFFTKKSNGTGLGLPITQGIIERHGGSIKVNSVLNEGTTFNIILGKLEEANYSI